MRERRSAPLGQVKDALTRIAALEGASSGVAWGDITGTLSLQTDLQSALDAKAASSHVHSAADITSGTLAVARGGTGVTTSTGTGNNVLSISPTLTGTLTAAAANFSGALTAASFGGITSANLVDKAATETISGLWTFTHASGIQINDSNTRLDEGSGNALRVQTNSGYIDIGPQNTSWAHLQTDRANFYMSTGLHVNGGINDYNAGSARPYLHLTNTGMTTGGNVTISSLTPSGGANGDIWLQY